ncbi:hypothetical protein ACEV9E_00285 [Vibrio parahaemolyticus]|nr:hypothetical protein [Vibrio parahaemolyticus]
MDDILESEEFKQLASELVNSMAQSAIAYGDVDVEGLTDEEAREKVISYLMSFKESGEDLVMRIDHKDTLLEEARNFVASEKYELELVTYATWWEHWLNGVLEVKLYKKDITDKEFKQVITSLNNRAKTTWFLKLIDLPEMKNQHLGVMGKLAEKRNSFVHYKYPPSDNLDSKESLREFFIEVEASLVYFIEYESINVYQSKRSLNL